MIRWSATRAARRLALSVPYAGAILAVIVLGATIRRKGVMGGVLDTALNATPFVGAAKNAFEFFRGDLIPDRPRQAPPVPDTAP